MTPEEVYRRSKQPIDIVDFTDAPVVVLEQEGRVIALPRDGVHDLITALTIAVGDSRSVN